MFSPGTASSVTIPLQGQSDDTQNILTQSGEDESLTKIIPNNEIDQDDYAISGPDEPTLDHFQNQVFLRKGDLVDLPTGSQPILAIFVRTVEDQNQYYTIRGEWTHMHAGQSQFAIPNFVHPNELNDLLPFLPARQIANDEIDRLQPMATNAPRGVGARVIKKMLLFQQTADDIFRENANRVNRAYEIAAPLSPNRVRLYKSLQEISLKVFQEHDASKISPEMMWVVHRSLLSSQNVVWDVMNYRHNPVYEIHPQQSLDDLNQVKKWMREFQEGVIEDGTEPSGPNPASKVMTRPQNPILTFVWKARITVEQSRRTRALSPSGGLGPSSVKVEPKEPETKSFRTVLLDSFDRNEQIILQYFDAWATCHIINRHTNLASLGPMILRAVGMYDGFALDQAVGFTFLQELGIHAPWENRTVHLLRNMTLPVRTRLSEETIQLRDEACRSLSEVVPRDAMKDFRKDWGELPVFCIDSVGTLDLDDGVSLQPIADDPSMFWVHIHIANPSAFLSPESAAARYAAQLSESVYLPECKFPMLPPAFTENHLSLTRNRPCITFSTKMTTNGAVVERQISHGVVHNVHRVSPRTLSRELGLGHEPQTACLLSVGGPFPADTTDQSHQTGNEGLAKSHVDILHRLLRLSETTHRRRTEAGARDIYSSVRGKGTYPHVRLSDITESSTVEDVKARRYEGDPAIVLETSTRSLEIVEKMVSDLMVLAGEVAAAWCSERNIPIPYRGILRNPEPASSPEDFRRVIIDPKVAKYGSAPTIDVLRYTKLLGISQASASPVEHVALGLPAYCKATSPLRRYVDIYTHWQIEAALRYEAETGASLIGSTDDSYLPFSRPQVEEYASTVRNRERKIAFTRNSSMRHWVTQALFRAFYFNEAPLPETFEVCIQRSDVQDKLGVAGAMEAYNFKVDVTKNALVDQEGGFQQGDRWECKLLTVNNYLMKGIVDPIRLIERDPR